VTKVGRFGRKEEPVKDAAPLKRGPALPDEVARFIRTEIESGALAPGQRLPTENELATSYDVSRPVVREAISRLRYDGLVETRQGQGAFVAKTGLRRSFRIEPAVVTSVRELSEVFELRIAVEADAAGFAALRHKREHAKKLRQALDLMDRAIRRGESGADADAAFHQEIATATGNKYYAAFMQFLESHLRATILTARTSSARYRGTPETVQAEHLAIFEAIDARDRVKAEAAMRKHLTNAAKRLKLPLLDGK
jgi:GntR family transcriptional repressor for pyruvate dehydrogenase complex